MSEKEAEKKQNELAIERRHEIEELRTLMGTFPEPPKRDNEFFVGCSGVKAKLIDYPENPYRAIFEIVTSTWGGRKNWMDKWARTSPEGRKEVVMAALTRNTLPVCLEAPKFTFAIEGLSRSAFDQLARARIGTGFGSVGTRDNPWVDAAFIIPDYIASKPELRSEYEDVCTKIMDLYQKIVEGEKASWQVARYILPMGVTHRFTMTINYLAFQSMCNTRLIFCEQFDTVGATWACWKELYSKYPLLAVYCRPGCDRTGKCMYHKPYSLSEAFGCLFKGCGRNPEQGDYQYYQFNEIGADIGKLEDQLKFHIPRPEEWKAMEEYSLDHDKIYFEDKADD